MKSGNAPQEDITINEEDAVLQSMNTSGIDSNVLSSPSPSSLLHEHDEHIGEGEGDTISGDVPEKEPGNDNVIYNQEVIKLNKDLNLERDIGSDCVIQAKGQSCCIGAIRFGKNEIGSEIVQGSCSLQRVVFGINLYSFI